MLANQDTTVGIQNFAEFSCVDSTGFGVVVLLKYMCCANMQEMEFQIFDAL